MVDRNVRDVESGMQSLVLECTGDWIEKLGKLRILVLTVHPWVLTCSSTPKAGFWHKRKGAVRSLGSFYGQQY